MATAMLINSSLVRQAARPAFQPRRASVAGLRRSLVVVRAEVRSETRWLGGGLQMCAMAQNMGALLCSCCVPAPAGATLQVLWM